jgi:hypothetical protein
MIGGHSNAIILNLDSKLVLLLLDAQRHLCGLRMFLAIAQGLLRYTVDTGLYRIWQRFVKVGFEHLARNPCAAHEILR